MMTDVVVAPSIGGLVIDCVLLLTRAVLVVVIVPSLLVFNSVHRKHTSIAIKGDKHTFQILATMKHQFGVIMLTSKHSLELFVKFNLNRIVVHCLHGLRSTSQCRFTVTGVNT